MFQVGDLILYGGTGVCRVIKVEERGEPKRLFYTLDPLYQTCSILTPADNERVPMRPILTEQAALDLIDAMPAAKGAAFHGRSSRELSEYYERAIKRYDCAELVVLAKSIYTKREETLRQNRKFGALDERFLKKAEDLLYGELGAALGLNREEVPGFIRARIGEK